MIRLYIYTFKGTELGKNVFSRKISRSTVGNGLPWLIPGMLGS